MPPACENPAEAGFSFCAPGGIRTPNLLIRSQMLYPLSYGRLLSKLCVDNEEILYTATSQAPKPHCNTTFIHLFTRHPSDATQAPGTENFSRYPTEIGKKVIETLG